MPFIDEKRLLDAIAKKSDGLTREEKERNAVGCDLIYMNNFNELFTS